MAQKKIDPAPYRAHLLELRTTYGLSLQALSALTGLSSRTMVDLIKEPASTKRDWITPETAERIRSAHFDLDKLPETSRVPTAGSLRRVQALALQGHSREYLARRHGVSVTALTASLDRDSIGVRMAREIRDLFEELIDTQGPSTHAIRRALAAGWVPAHAWDGETIDDPHATPERDLDIVDEVAIERVLAGTPTPLTRIEFIEVIRRGSEHGVSADDLAAVLGCTRRTIIRYRRVLDENATTALAS